MKIEIKINGNEYKFEDFMISQISLQEEQIEDLLNKIASFELKLNPAQNIVGEHSIKYTPLTETLR